MIKINPAKIWLSFVALAGIAVGMLLYNQTLWLFDKVVDSHFTWILVPVVIGLFVYIIPKLRGDIKNDLEKTDSTNEINLRMVLDIFVGGFVGFYMMLAIVSMVALIVYLIIRFFYS